MRDEIKESFPPETTQQINDIFFGNPNQTMKKLKDLTSLNNVELAAKLGLELTDGSDDDHEHVQVADKQELIEEVVLD